MILKNNLYKYKSVSGGEVVSPYKPECEYESMYRLSTSSTESTLTNGFVFTDFVDISARDLDLWREVLKDDLNVDVNRLDALMKLVLNGDMQSLAYELYPNDFAESDGDENNGDI